MAKKISELAEETTPADTSDFEIAQSGSSFRVTWSTIKSLIRSVVTAADVGLGSVLNAAQLTRSNNLSDLTNTSNARSNIGLGNVPNEDATDPYNMDQRGASDGAFLAWDSGNSRWQPKQPSSGTQVDFGTLSVSSTGDVSITGLGFAPKKIKFEAALAVATTDEEGGPSNTSDSEENFGGVMIGFAKDDGGSTVQQVFSSGVSGNSVNSIRVFASSGKCVGVSYGAANGTTETGEIQGSLKTFDGDGFTINIDTFSGMGDLGSQQIMWTAYS